MVPGPPDEKLRPLRDAFAALINSSTVPNGASAFTTSASGIARNQRDRPQIPIRVIAEVANEIAVDDEFAGLAEEERVAVGRQRERRSGSPWLRWRPADIRA